MPNLKKSLIHFNILVSQTNQPPIYTKLIRWLLSSGRFIVIMVELVVILGFVARFKFDQDLSDLDDKIKEQIPYIQSLKEDELLVRHTQFQLSTILSEQTNRPDFISAFNKIAAITPTSIKINLLNINASTPDKTQLKISGASPSSLAVEAFITALKKDPIFAEINLASISVEKQQVVFSIQGVIKRGASWWLLFIPVTLPILSR